MEKKLYEIIGRLYSQLSDSVAVSETLKNELQSSREANANLTQEIQKLQAALQNVSNPPTQDKPVGT